MVKRAKVLETLQGEADLPYEETRLSRAAAKARPRLALLLALGAVALALEVVLQASAWWALLATLVGLAALGVRQGRLAGIMAAGFIDALALLLPIPILALVSNDATSIVTGVVALVWGAAMAPLVLTLVRDAELQHAYGRWARR